MNVEENGAKTVCDPSSSEIKIPEVTKKGMVGVVPFLMRHASDFNSGLSACSLMSYLVKLGYPENSAAVASLRSTGSSWMEGRY